jgi:hypothetical protein
MKLACELESIRAFLVYATLLMVTVTSIVSDSKSVGSCAPDLVVAVTIRRPLGFLLQQHLRGSRCSSRGSSVLASYS